MTYLNPAKNKVGLPPNVPSLKEIPMSHFIGLLRCQSRSLGNKRFSTPDTEDVQYSSCPRYMSVITSALACLLAGAQNWESAGGKGEWDYWERPRRYIVTTDAPTGRPCAGVSAPPLTHSFPSTSVCCLSAAATSKTILLRLSGAFS